MSATRYDLSEHVREARQAHGETAVSLSILGDKIAQAREALAAGNHERARHALDGAINEVGAAHGYLSIARDEHREINRFLTRR